MKITVIKIPQNYYGGLHVMEKDGKYYWLIEDFDTSFEEMSEWKEIPKSLYDELIKFNDEQN